MPQVLIISGHPKDIDRKFVRDAIPFIYGMERGHRIQIQDGQPAAPEVYQRGDFFFFANLEPVTDAKDVEHLPNGKPPYDFKDQALRQVKRLQVGGEKAVKKLKGRHDPSKIRKGVVRPAPGAGFLSSRPTSTRRMSEMMPEGAEAE